MRKIAQSENGFGQQSGFALVLALLALLLLTFLGLTLAVTTSTELQIATNYRWSQQAVYAAEAGVEAGKAVLRNVPWAAILPPPRNTAWAGTATPSVAGTGVSWVLAAPDAWGHPSRNYEGWQCDNKGQGMGYGVVLDDRSGDAPFQNINTLSTVYGGQSLGNAAFTLWVRRPLHYLPTGDTVDWGGTVPPETEIDDSNLILTVEGVAPFSGATGAAQGSWGKAVHVIEVALSQTPPQASCRAARAGQQGSGPEGANNAGCEPLEDGPTALAGAMQGASHPGGGAGNLTGFGGVK
jgi:hypothetical protein